MSTILTFAEQIQRQLDALEQMTRRTIPVALAPLDAGPSALTLHDGFAEVSNMVSQIVTMSNTMLGAAGPLDKLSNFAADLAGDLKRWRDESRALEPAAFSLGEKGWTIPMWMTPRSVQHVLALGPTVNLDDWFRDVYEADNRAAENELLDGLPSHSALATRRVLIEQCIADFRDDRYLAPLPALVAMIEGLMADASPHLVGERSPLKLAKHLRDEGAPSMSFIALASVVAFAEQLYEFAPFDGPHPGRLSRHWILHGRDPGTWQRIDALRMLHVLDTLASVMPFISVMRARRLAASPVR